MRIASSHFPGIIESVAFKNPDGSKVLLVLNPATAETDFKVRYNGKSFVYRLAGGAVVTFVWQGDDLPVPLSNLAGTVRNGQGQPIAGVTVDVSKDGIVHSIVTDGDGRYGFLSLEAGAWKITPHKPGFDLLPGSEWVTMPPGAEALDFIAQPTTFAIMGRIVNGAGQPVGGVRVEIATGGIVVAEPTTDASGVYTAADLTANAYTVTPVKAGFAFDPATRTVSVPPDATGVDFTGADRFTISGQLIDQAGQPISGATVAIATGGIVVAEPTTGNDGGYIAEDLPTGSYTVTPAKPGHAFAPASRTVTVPPSALGVNFSGQRNRFIITGRVTGSAGQPVGGVRVEIATGGIVVAEPTTDASGAYTAADLTANAYTVTPIKAGFAFEPATHTVSVPPDATGVDFTGADRFTISGQVVDQAGQPISGATVAIATGGIVVAEPATGNDGGYIAEDLPAGSYTVTPARPGHAFAPASRAIAVPPSALGVNFTGSVSTHTIAGVISHNGFGLADVVVALGKDGIEFTQTVADANGAYRFAGLAEAGTYTVRPQKDGFTFTPAQRTATVPPDQESVNFAAAAFSAVVTGRVRSNGLPLPGATLTITGPLGSTNTLADAGGFYTFTVTNPGAYALSAAKLHYSFAPAAIQIALNSPGILNVADLVGTPSSDFSPVVFIPGIMGSHLRKQGSSDDLWPGQVWGTDHSVLSNRPGERQAIYAPDVIRRAVVDFYNPLLTRLTESRREYAVNNDPSRRTTAGCDLSQAIDNPALFVFAYDWRLSNDGTADLLADYIGCIHRFYPGVKVNIVAHSMGGLVARRYIIDHRTSHSVRRLITIGTPWLGAPGLLEKIETGQLGLPNVLLWPNEVRTLLEAFPGAHELLPSATYFAYAQASGEKNVFVEDGWDINGQGGNKQTYNYDDLIGLVNRRYPKERSCPDLNGNVDVVCQVGTNNENFHAVSGQDTWVSGPNDVDYHYIVGRRRSKDTFAGYIAKRYCSTTECEYYLVPTKTEGDGTVPLVSARRAPLDGAPDGTGAIIHRMVSSDWIDDKDDSNTEHLGMTHNPVVQDLILNLLNGQAGAKTAEVEQPLPPVEPAYYLNVFGSGAAYVTNADGQVTGAVSPTLTLNQAGEIAYFPSSTGNFLVVIPTTGVYTVTFASGVEPMFIELVREGDLPPDYAVRWQQQNLPSNVTVQLLLSPSGVHELTYDSNGDGAPETVLPPTVELTGPEAQDTQPPTVDAHITVGAGSVQAELTATDSESGVGAIFYSLNGTEFQPYSAPFVVSPLQTDTLYAFADDNAANRSGLFSFPLGIDVNFLPIISTGGGSPQ